MPSTAAPLRTPPNHPQSRRPAHVQALQRPPALVKARELAFLRFEVPDLDATEAFMLDFGMRRTERTADSLVMRGTGSSPCIYAATRGPKARFVGSAFTVPAGTDLERLAGRSSVVFDS
jgi:hypothetical protein